MGGTKVKNLEAGGVVLSSYRVLDLSDDRGHLAGAILAAVEHRRQTGGGQYIDLSQVEASLLVRGPAVSVQHVRLPPAVAAAAAPALHHHVRVFVLE